MIAMAMVVMVVMVVVVVVSMHTHIAVVPPCGPMFNPAE
jgi:hypothetical protein